MQESGDRGLLTALPLPLAQAWRRARFCDTPAALHERTLFTLEATLKFLASAAACEWVAIGRAPEGSGDEARTACQALVRPSLGQWAAILRTCLKALPPGDPVRRFIDGVFAKPVSSRLAGLDGRFVEAILDSLPSYRNAIAHGAGLAPTEVDRRAPSIESLARVVLRAVAGEGAPRLSASISGRTVTLVGPTALFDAASNDADGVTLRLADHAVSLSPLWVFDPEEDDLLVLNKGAGLAKVEYLSYGAPRGGSGLVVLRGATADSLARFLEKATGRAKLDAGDVADLVDQTEARELLGRAGTRRIGPYRIVRKIAEGGQGVIYEAVEEDPPRRVALKTLSMHGAIDDASRRRFREEGAALAKVEHPGVVPVYATGESDGVPWIAMKFVEGKSLAQVLDALHGHAGLVTLADWNRAVSTREDRPDEEKKKPHAERVAMLGRDAARALAACHERGIVHRDVKPGNLMLDGEGRVLLTDFGLARPMDARSRTFTQKIVGTLQYLAPEALIPSGRRSPDGGVDVYGLGATLYEALSLRRPFEEYEADERLLLQAVQVKDPPALRKVAPSVPRDLETIVAKAMEKDRERRYASATALADELDRYLKHEPIHAKPMGPVTRTAKWARRNPARAMALAVLVLAIGGSAAAWGVTTTLRHRAVADRLRIGNEALARGDCESAIASAVAALDREPDSGAAVELRTRAEKVRDDAATAKARQEALDAASKTRADAAGKDMEYAAALVQLAAIRKEIAALHDECFGKYAPTAKRAHLNGLEKDLAKKELDAERLVAEWREALERAARFEATIGGTSPETKAAFATYFMGRWRELLDSKDDARRNLNEEAVRKHDAEKHHDAEILGRGTLTVDVDPSDAQIYLFRYEPYETVRLDVVSRLVPVPTSGVDRCREAAWVGGFFPGDLCLVITKVEVDSPAAKAGLRRGDLVIRVNDQPSGDGLFVRAVTEGCPAAKAGVKPLDRIEAIDGEVVESSYDWEQIPIAKEPGGEPYRLEVAGKKVEGPHDKPLREALGLEVATSVDLVSGKVSAGAMTLSCLRDGEPVTVVVAASEPSGLECEVTAYPLILSKDNRVAARSALQADPNSYLLFVRKDGFEDQRYPVVVSRGSTVSATVKLLPAGTTPEGFVYVPPGPFIYGGDPEAFEGVLREEKPRDGFFIGRLEVMNREWFEFVNDPETLKQLEDGKSEPGKWLPRNPDRSPYCRKDENTGRYDATYGSDETPVLGINWNDIQAFLSWKNQKAEAAGEKWRYQLPSEREWEKSARGVDGRLFVWGDRFDFSLAVSRNRKKGQLYGVSGEFEPRDDSSFGVRDLGGSRWEWTRDESAPSSGTYVLRGGAWGSFIARGFWCAFRLVLDPTNVGTSHGFRLVARPTP